ncbi:TM2 domain-containing protein [Cyanobium sp. CH-040]|uniref:TM2 domain-containing protein n=1 Tax=Cyanobium sp. CH-040 TaxID=2823708 RepID=UPI0020CDCE50|nr:TM2 domain-containing protein [Cyanobium sp. CH-040]MCP9926813.1 TM2 domain-containing protein [Cyanobium sp. CH-040]
MAGPLVRDGERRTLALSYLLWGLGLLGVCGLQRFYNRKPYSGTLYLLSFGLCGVGQLVDLWLMPEMVDRANTLPLLRRGQPLPLARQLLERQLLELARRSGDRGFTINDALLALQPGSPVDSQQLRAEIQRLLENHLLDVGNDPRGRVVYREP